MDIKLETLNLRNVIFTNFEPL